MLYTVLFPPFLAKAAVLDGETSVMDLIKVFISKISDRGSEASTDTSESRGRGGSGEENETTNNMEDRKSVDRQETDTIIFYCNNFLAFLQSSALMNTA